MQLFPYIHLFGAFSFKFGDEPIVTLNTPRLQSLVAYLLLHRNAPQPRQHLAFLLWPDTTETQAQSNLRQLVHRLRAAEPQLDAYLLVGQRTLQWNGAAPFNLDVLEFERILAQVNAQSVAAEQAGGPSEPEDGLQSLGAAVELYIGDLLPGLYYEWIIPERERLRQRYIDALEALATGLAKEGRYAEARLHAEKLKSADPLRESTYRILMEVCSGTGDYSGAVRYYQECAATLDSELGVQPGPTTQATYRRILQLATEHQEAVASLDPGLPVVTHAKKVPTNLPASPSSFVGRNAEMAAVNALLRQDTVRLLTLVGAPGVGKTRLASQVALGMSRIPTNVGDEATPSAASSFPDGVYMVPLAPVSDPALVASTVANALGVREQANRPIVETLEEWLGDKRFLLLLDNFEHLLGQSLNTHAAMLVSNLLSSCKDLKVLVTSREALKLYGEHEFPVPPLELPSTEDAIMMEAHRLGEYSAVRLFEERAAAAHYGFTLNAENTATVAAICRRLESLPLAIELAATRVKLLPPDLLLKRLEQRLDELTSGARDVPARHRTLRAAIEWSYDLLDSNEQLLFRDLGVFVGGCTLEAAQDVFAKREFATSATGSEPANDRRQPTVEAILRSLLDKSLLYSATSADGTPRYSMLEMIREYALEQLAASGESEEIGQRHLLYYVTLAEQAYQELRAKETKPWVSVFEEELGNYRAAIGWALDRRDSASVGAIVRQLHTFWLRANYLHEPLSWLESVLALGESVPSEVRAIVLNVRGMMYSNLGNLAQARESWEEVLQLRRDIGDRGGRCQLLEQSRFFDHRDGRLSASRSSINGIARNAPHGRKHGERS